MQTVLERLEKLKRVDKRSRLSMLLLFLTLVGVPMYSQNEKSKTSARLPELTPRRPECGILLSERDERYDMARLIRADEFLDCERDGFPKALAPPWKDTLQGEKSCPVGVSTSRRRQSANTLKWVQLAISLLLTGAGRT
jgi:hypothetical protein